MNVRAYCLATFPGLLLGVNSPVLANENDNVENIEVTASPVSPYRVSETAYATRTPTDIEKIPQSISVITETLIVEQGAREAADIYRNVAGLTQNAYSVVTLRGFRQSELLYDGVRGDPFASFSMPRLFNIQEVVVLKGPSGAVYGTGDPGGVVSYVTKKPSNEDAIKISGELGNYGFVGGSLELTGSIGSAETQAYRIGVYVDREKPFRYNTKSENRVIDLGYSFELGEDTSLTLQYTDIVNDLQGSRMRGVPVDDTGNFLADIRWNHNEATDFQDLHGRTAQAIFKHKFSNEISFDFTVRYYNTDEAQNYHEPRGFRDADDDGIVDYSLREFRDQVRDNEGISFTANYVTGFETGDVEHTLLVGGEWYHQVADLGQKRVRQQPRGVVPGIDLINPVYGQTSPSDYGLDALDRYRIDAKTTRYGLYIQDQIALSEAWDVTAGLRYDHYKDTDKSVGFDVSRDDLTFRVGTTYNIGDTFYPYALFATGYKPHHLEDQNAEYGGPFTPETSKVFELGAKMIFADGRVSLNAAAYSIRKSGILQEDPNSDEWRQIQLGSVLSKGFELELVASLTESWLLTANYAYNHIRKEDVDIDDPLADRLSNAPENVLSVWMQYRFEGINSALSAGFTHVGEQISPGDQLVKSYTVFDANWQTEIGGWLIRAGVKNLFDKEYATSGFISRGGHFPGEPRRVFLSVGHSF